MFLHVLEDWKVLREIVRLTVQRELFSDRIPSQFFVSRCCHGSGCDLEMRVWF